MVRKPGQPAVIPPATNSASPVLDEELPEAGTTFALPTPGRERIYGTFDGIPPGASTMCNVVNRHRVIE